MAVEGYGVAGENAGVGRKFAVLGSPIAHSLSPQIHSAAFAELGLVGWEYCRHEVQAAELADFLQGAGAAYSGFSVTMPLKEQAAQIAVKRCELTAATGVANTLLRVPTQDSGAGVAWQAYNTDIPGLQQACKRAGLNWQNTVILGAGATALSAGVAALRAGAERVLFVARRARSARNIAAKLCQLAQTRAASLQISTQQTIIAAASFVSEAPFFVAEVVFFTEPDSGKKAADQGILQAEIAGQNTVGSSPENASSQPSGVFQNNSQNTKGDRADHPTCNANLDAKNYTQHIIDAATLTVSTLPGGADLPLPEALLKSPLYDVAYSPWPSTFALRWDAAGTPAHSGLSMLAEQALLQLRLFTAGDIAAPLPDETGLLQTIHGIIGLK